MLKSPRCVPGRPIPCDTKGTACQRQNTQRLPAWLPSHDRSWRGFGDIGTSPLYTLKECFHGPHAIPITETNILGILSLIFWSIMVVVTVKYVCFVTKADNDGAGGGVRAAGHSGQYAASERPQSRFRLLPYLALCSAALCIATALSPRPYPCSPPWKA